MNQQHLPGQPGDQSGMQGWSSAKLVSGDKLRGARINNSNAESVGTVEDVVIDRGSGRIAYVVVSSGTVLGMGGRNISVPASSLQWDQASDTLTLNATGEQLKTYHEFNKDRWTSTARDENGQMSTLSNSYYRDSSSWSNMWNRQGGQNDLRSQPDSGSGSGAGSGSGSSSGGRGSDQPGSGGSGSGSGGSGQPGSGGTGSGSGTGGSGTGSGSGTGQPGMGAGSGSGSSTGNRNQPGNGMNDTNNRNQTGMGGQPSSGMSGDRGTTIRGRVRSIGQQMWDNGGDATTVVVEGDDQRDREIVVGPSWYANSADGFYRGAPIEVQTSQVDINGRQHWMARNMKVNDRDYPLYDQSGKPSWHQYGSSMSVTPFVLLSELDGKAVMCRGESCGKIDDVIFAMPAHRLVFVSIDPDQNILGIGDTKRLVPWSIVHTSMNDAVTIDASKEMITQAPETPRNLTDLSQGEGFRRIYSSYDVPQAQLNSRTMREGDRRADVPDDSTRQPR